MHIDLCHIRNCSTQGGVFLLEEFGKYKAYCRRFQRKDIACSIKPALTIISSDVILRVDRNTVPGTEFG